MTLYLVHHAEALPASQDPLQPLSDKGRLHAQALASRAKSLGAKPSFIWHSGKLRARQTAEAMLLTCNPFAAFRMMKGLQPDDRPGVAAALVEEVDDDLMVVSHAPLLSALAEELGVRVLFPLHGMLALARVQPGRYVVEWKAE